jgi:transcriptional regulator with XRE-family HTH domain
MGKELFMLADKLKILRDKSGMTQSDLARKLGLTRAGVNAWEMGLSVPSTPYIVELAKTFHVSSDFLLGLENTATIPIQGLSEKQVAVILDLISCFK